MIRPLIDRFSEKYTIDPSTQCWVWNACKDGKGYGRIYPGPPAKAGDKLQANRASWMLFRGDIPDGLHVLHKCDNPPCVNPDHLFLGTHADNMRDKELKSRSNHAAKSNPGSTHPEAKLTEAKVIRIRELRAKGIKCRIIAEQFDVTTSTISDVCTRSWRHI